MMLSRLLPLVFDVATLRLLPADLEAGGTRPCASVTDVALSFSQDRRG